MKKKPENQFLVSVHRHLNSRVYKMKNNNMYIGGIPDVWYSGRRADLWVEYKYIPVSVPTATVVPDLSGLQFQWIKARQAEGRNVWTVVGFKDGAVIYRDMYEMEFGIPAPDFLERAITRKELAEEIYKFCY